MLWRLPPNDPRFLDTDEYEMALDVVAARFFHNPKLRDEIVTDDYDELLDAMEKASENLGEGDDQEQETPIDPSQIDDWETVG